MAILVSPDASLDAGTLQRLEAFEKIPGWLVKIWKKVYNNRRSQLTSPQVNLMRDREVVYVKSSLINWLITQFPSDDSHVVFKFGCSEPGSPTRCANLRVFVYILKKLPGNEIPESSVYELGDDFYSAPDEHAPVVALTDFNTSIANLKERIRLLRLTKEWEGVAFKSGLILDSKVLEYTVLKAHIAFNDRSSDFHNTVIIQGVRSALEGFIRDEDTFYDHGNQCCPIN